MTPLPDSDPVAARAIDWRTADTDAFRLSWSALADNASAPNPFYEVWYLLPALRALDPEGSVQLFTLVQGDTIVGLMPVRREPRYYGRPLAHLASWSHGNSFFGAPLIRAGYESAFWQALLCWADRAPRRPLFLHLRHMPMDGAVGAALIAELARDRRFHAAVHREQRALLQSALSAADYFEASLSAKKRKELRRQNARLAELGTVEIERREDGEGLQAWIDEFLAIERLGWKGQAGSALASHPETETLFRSALAGAAEHGRLQRLAVRLDSKPIAMLAQFLCPPGAFSFKTAFDEDYGRFSPGVLLQRENLALLDRPDIDWCDSCAAADHPMIDHIWRERRAIGHVSIAIGGGVRRALFRQLARVEMRRKRP